jgi:predicted RNA-binding Zn ribbon-like protein
MFRDENHVDMAARLDHRHPPALFLADALGLDFLNSVATPVDTQVDWITDGDGLLAWLQQARLASAETLNDLRARTTSNELDNVAAQARDLREWFREFVCARKGRTLTAGDLNDLSPLNRLLERDASFSRITAGGTAAKALEIRKTRHWQAPDSLLLPIAEVLATLVCEENFANVKACEGPACTLLFADHTRGRVRRWCSMAICGNRAKQAAHRSRARRPASSPVPSDDPPHQPTVTRQAPQRSSRGRLRPKAKRRESHEN